MISLQKVKQETDELHRIRTLFLSAFPPEERPPFFFLKARMKRNVDWWSIYRDGDWAGFFYVIYEHNLIYVSFFAIDPSVRGKGCGTEAMKQLIGQYRGKRVFLAIEPVDPRAENYQERVNRKNFYKRCGLVPLGKSIQEGSMIYELLGTGGNVEAAEYTSLMKRWLGWPVKYFVPVHMVHGC